MIKATRFIDLVTAVLVSALVPTILFTIIVGICGASFADLRFAAIFGLAISLLHTVVLGLPGIAFLWRLGWVNYGSSSLVGFIAGCAPLGVFLWVTLPSGTVIKAWGPCGLPIIVEGEIIDAGLLGHFAPLLHSGGFGALAGLSFCLALKWMTK